MFVDPSQIHHQCGVKIGIYFDNRNCILLFKYRMKACSWSFAEVLSHLGSKSNTYTVLKQLSCAGYATNREKHGAFPEQLPVQLQPQETLSFPQ